MLTNTGQIEDDLMLIPVVTKRKLTETGWKSGLVPRKIALEIGFYQRTASVKEILTAELTFSDFIDGTENSSTLYTFTFHMHPLNWLDCFDFDGFRDSEYYASVLVLCLLLFGMPLGAFIIAMIVGKNRLNSGGMVFIRQYLVASGVRTR